LHVPGAQGRTCRFERKQRGARVPAGRQNALRNTKEIDMNILGNSGARAAAQLRFGFGRFSLGRVLVAVAAEGVAAILIGDDEAALQRELARAFPPSDPVRDDAGLAPVVQRVCTYLDAPQGKLGLPLAPRGSALELAVWEALRAIPHGRTATYGQIAGRLPLPATAQEVGAACAANLLAVAIPCHRVVKSDGSVSGYRWGVQRKRRLLAREAAA
jgi:AraC family transcriptional regulator, regulatory protein of adaptative response / methylated-DNA-[protein]-cysteine methyltransferase